MRGKEIRLLSHWAALWGSFVPAAPAALLPLPSFTDKQGSWGPRASSHMCPHSFSLLPFHRRTRLPLTVTPTAVMVTTLSADTHQVLLCTGSHCECHWGTQSDTSMKTRGTHAVQRHLCPFTMSPFEGLLLHREISYLS